MTTCWAVYRREIKAYFQSPSTWVVLALLFAVVGVLFQDLTILFSRLSMNSGQMAWLGQTDEAPNATEFLIRPTFQMLTSLILFTIPLLSMRLISEERSRGTFELLVTCPLGDWAILLGKYFALLSVGALIVALSGVYPLIVWWAGRANGSAPEWPVVASCGVGLGLIFAAYAAFGLMASSLTRSQAAAGVVTLIGLLMWFVLGEIQMESFPQLRVVLRELSANQHAEHFISGALTLRDLAYYALASFLFLFIAARALDARRWRV